jgi:hypothetical protein
MESYTIVRTLLNWNLYWLQDTLLTQTVGLVLSLRIRVQHCDISRLRLNGVKTVLSFTFKTATNMTKDKRTNEKKTYNNTSAVQTWDFGLWQPIVRSV